MHRLQATPLRLIATTALGLLLPAIAMGACSRSIGTPVSPTGLSVTVDGDAIGGIYPDLLRSLGDKESCTFTFTAVPRARQELLFESGKADILIPATRTAKRDAVGIFVPLIRNRATLISIESGRPAIASAHALAERRELKVVLVRGFDYGTPYQDLVKELTAQGRVSLEPDALSVARRLKSGTADVTIMAPSILAGAIQGDPRVGDLMDRLRLEPIAELPWGESGVYLSRSSLSPQDMATLQDLLERTAKSGVVWHNFQRYYAPAILKEGIRPL